MSNINQKPEFVFITNFEYVEDESFNLIDEDMPKSDDVLGVFWYGPEKYIHLHDNGTFSFKKKDNTYIYSETLRDLADKFIKS